MASNPSIETGHNGPPPAVTHAIADTPDGTTKPALTYVPLPPVTKETCQDPAPPPPVLAPGAAPTPRKRRSFSLRVPASFLFFPGQMTQCGDSHGGWALTSRRLPPLAHVWLARSVGLIAIEVNKTGDKNQFEEKPGTQEAARCVCRPGSRRYFQTVPVRL